MFCTGQIMRFYKSYTTGTTKKYTPVLNQLPLKVVNLDALEAGHLLQVSLAQTPRDLGLQGHVLPAFR